MWNLSAESMKPSITTFFKDAMVVRIVGSRHGIPCHLPLKLM
jgi:hypothetical protein